MRYPRTYLAIALLLAATTAAVGVVFARQMRVGDTADAVQVFAQAAYGQLCENPNVSDQQIHATVRFVASASVVRVEPTEDGQAADAWGTPLSIRITRQPVPAVTCTSAGRDRVMGTPDDIAFTVTQ